MAMILRFGAAAFFLLSWLVVLMPLNAVLTMAGSAVPAYQAAYGSIWDGRIYGMRIGGESVREIALALRPAGFLTGSAVADFQVSDPDVHGRGRVSMRGRQLGIENTVMEFELARMGLPSVPGLPVSERVSVTIDRVRLDGDRCLDASGTVRTRALERFAETHGYRGPVLDGDLGCEGDELVLGFAGRSDHLALSGRMTLRRADYGWTLQAQTDQAELADLFALTGLQRDGRTWRAQGDRGYAQ